MRWKLNRNLLDPSKNGDESGQAVVEYVLMLMTALMIVTIIFKSFNRSVIALWMMMSRDIAAACPGCPPEPPIPGR